MGVILTILSQGRQRGNVNQIIVGPIQHLRVVSISISHDKQFFFSKIVNICLILRFGCRFGCSKNCLNETLVFQYQLYMF